MIDTQLSDHLVALTRDLILIPSTDSRPDERARAFSFFLNHLEPLDGVRVQRHQSGGYESIVALPAHHDRAEILMIGHLDVIEHPDLNLYRSHIHDGRLYGPGAGDMKAALAIMLKLFSDIHRESPGIPFGIVITSDEERGGEHGIGYLTRDAGLSTTHAIVPDGGSLHEVTVEEKGIAHLQLVARGAASHAARPWLANNAAARLTMALSRLASDFPVPPADNHWVPTCSITRLHTPNRTPNCIPDHAEATLDLRFPAPHTLDEMLTRIRHCIGQGIDLEVMVAASPTQLNPDPLWFQITEEITGVPARQVRASGGSDARFLCSKGIQTIAARPEVGNLHASNEWVDIKSMTTFYHIAREYVSRTLAI